MKVKLATLSLAAVMLTSPALANEGNMEEKAKHYFEKIDTNKDSKISKEEHDAFGNHMFTEADTDKDGSISLTELTTHKQKEKDESKSETGAGEKH